MRSVTDDSAGRHDASQLAELLRCERELAELLSAAQAEARQRVDEARAAAKALEAETEASLGKEADRLRAGIRERTQARAREIRAEALEQVARFDRVTDEQIEALAEVAFRLLVRREDAS
jgi:vacuolar-type H+-ATPase subunit H